ncbi:M23 family metallopeptidase [Alkaliphilus pronyensis]|uniref:M23 family metallopeptidase n=1 Tax=Alkaliphilus pronyensis TaxID=1482732 RepID=A0A6I0FIU9_9FIRM|nr:M23 family metallopeptidase [Alkaliphilus pronyensis]KAB3536061.1 M23 family metallopeptidase [Alkaliphilus pronyensis]
MEKLGLTSIITKAINITGFLLVLMLVVERTLSPPQVYLNIARLIILTIFITSALSLPLVKKSKLLYKAIGVACIALYFIGIFVSELFLMASIAIIIAIVFIFIDTFTGFSITEDTQNEVFPLPAPSERAGSIKIIMNCYITSILAFLNPFQFYQIIMQIIGMIGSSGLKNFKQKGNYSLPFEDEWLIMNGGIDQKDSHSWEVINQRYAYDFVMADSNNIRHINEGNKLTDYICFGKNILSPADGEVMATKNNVRDYPYPGTMKLDFLSTDFRGNFVIIKHEENEYSFMAHFIPGSIRVKKGDYVKRGEVIGRCGNSGHSTEPHLHLHFQNRPSFYFADGLPIKFSSLKVNGNFSSQTFIKKGERVANK